MHWQILRSLYPVVWLPVWKSSSAMVQAFYLGLLGGSWMKRSVKSLMWYFQLHSLHPSAWELHWSLPKLLSRYACALTIYLAGPDHVSGQTTDLPSHCEFIQPSVDSCLTLVTALFLQVLPDREILACALLTLSSWISFPCETVTLLLLFGQQESKRHHENFPFSPHL